LEDVDAMEIVHCFKPAAAPRDGAMARSLRSGLRPGLLRCFAGMPSRSSFFTSEGWSQWSGLPDFLKFLNTFLSMFAG
jgi:hypothetical protein